MEIKETMIERPIFAIEEVKVGKVNAVGYIPETKEIFVHLFDAETGKPEIRAYFFKNCDKEIYDEMLSNKDTIYNFILDILYPTKNYSLEYFFMND